MSAGIPTVMVSSTFYDLRQIRADLTDFLTTQLGYQPLLSELASFPVDPDVDTVENCRRRVENDADVLVLVVGGRYGHVDERSAKSVTNLEYLAAQAKGIPVYAFVQKEVLTLLAVWQNNPEADLSHAVDDSRVLEFIREVRSVHRVWTREFETAQDIISSLRTQFAHLAYEGSIWSRRLGYSNPSSVLHTLRGRALRLALERPMLWEFLLLFQTAADELEKHRGLRREHDLGLAFGTGSELSLEDFGGWTRKRLDELRRLGEGLMELLGPPIRAAHNSRPGIQLPLRSRLEASALPHGSGNGG